MKRLAVPLLAALLSLGGNASLAQAPPPPHQGAGRDVLKDLNLSPEQSARLKELREKAGQKMRDLERQMMEKRRALERLYGEFNLDEAKARQLGRDINTLQRDILEAHLRVEQGLRRILTPEQFTKMRTAMAGRWKSRFPRGADRQAPPGKP